MSFSRLSLKGFIKSSISVSKAILSDTGICLPSILLKLFSCLQENKIVNTANNAIYADVVKGNDTLRVYNVHLQSLRIDANVENLKTEDSERLINKAGETFKMQQEQAELFVEHKDKSPYKMVICGDFNNTAYSYVYKEIKGDLKDSFEEAGNGFGRTFDFRYFPVRIDFILVDDAFEVNNFKVHEEKLSDHYPIHAKISLH